MLLQKKDKIKIRLKLLKKHGCYICNICKLSPDDLIKINRSPVLFIDHIDNNPDNNNFDNFQHLCASCNKIKNHPRNKFLEIDLEIDNSSKIELSLSKKYRRKTLLFIEGLLNDPANSGHIRYDKRLLINICAVTGCCEKTAKENVCILTAELGGVFKSYTGNHDQYHIKKIE